VSVVDTSVLTAILLNEPEAGAFVDYLEGADSFLPASVLVEAGIVAVSRGKKVALDTLVESMDASIISLDEFIAQAAVDAYKQYGKGRHKASLNFGDCLVYATAKHLNIPLLFKGNDFIHTDVICALC
jgi:ribonuclease VapC